MCTPPQPFAPVDNTAKIEIRQRLSGQNILTRLFFQIDEQVQSGNLADLCEAVSQAWVDNFAPLVSVDLSLVEVYGLDVSQENGVEHTVSTGGVGTLVQDALPNNVTLAVSFRTGRSGRSYRGRAFWPGLTENQVDSNTVNTTTVNAIQDAWENFSIDVSSNAPGWYHVVASYCQDGEWLTTGEATRVTSYVIVDPIVDSQRRRLPGRGQ